MHDMVAALVIMLGAWALIALGVIVIVALTALVGTFVTVAATLAVAGLMGLVA